MPEAVEHRLLEWHTDHVTDLEATALEVTLEDGRFTCSLDGETDSVDRVSVAIRPGRTRPRGRPRLRP